MTSDFLNVGKGMITIPQRLGTEMIVAYCDFAYHDDMVSFYSIAGLGSVTTEIPPTPAI